MLGALVELGILDRERGALGERFEGPQVLLAKRLWLVIVDAEDAEDLALDDDRDTDI